jgi:hypothetical protein
MNTTPLPCENGTSIWIEVVLSKRLKDNTIRGLGKMEKIKSNPVHYRDWLRDIKE